MAPNAAHPLHQSDLVGGVSGSWKLAPDQAMTLHPGQAGVLRVTQGKVWATLDGPHHGPANDWGDLVLQGGQQLWLLPGQHVVVEPFGDAVNQPAYFRWEPMPPVVLPSEMAGWTALFTPFLLLGRLVARVASAAGWFVAGRGRVLSPLESNQP